MGRSKKGIEFVNMWSVYVIGEARKQIKKFPRFEQERIRDSLNRLRENPFNLDVIRLGDKDHTWRLRVGNYRLFLELFQKEKAIFIYNIKRRTSTTY